MIENMSGLAAYYPLWERFLEKLPEIIVATWETLDMVLLSTLFSLLSGFLLAILMIVTNPIGLKPNRSVYQAVDFVVNLLRSFPFIILLIALIPFTRFVVGTSIGSAAAIVPLTIAAAPFVNLRAGGSHRPRAVRVEVHHAESLREVS